jgi:hypothetical protein
MVAVLLHGLSDSPLLTPSVLQRKGTGACGHKLCNFVFGVMQ